MPKMDNSEVSKENPLRKLARDFYWQSIFNRAKEISGIKLFYNDSDFTQFQILFLHYLEQISNLYLDVATNEELINSEVVEDWLRAESYLLYKRKKREEEKNKVVDNSPKATDSIVFVAKRKQRK